MPAFARKYSMSCKTCHTPFPKLKPYGGEFAANGFVIKDKDTPRYFVDTGDSALSLLRELPIALRLEGFVAWNNANTGQLDFISPYILKFLSGGAITKSIAYYFYFFLSERGEIAGLEDAFVMFNDLFGTDLDLYVGQFQVSDPLFKREVRLPFELNVQYVERRDTNPYFAVIQPIEKVITRGAFAELIYLPKGDDSRIYAAGLINWVDSDQPDLRYTAATAHVGYLLRRNVRMTAEATCAFRGPYGKHVRVGTGLVFGF